MAAAIEFDRDMRMTIKKVCAEERNVAFAGTLVFRVKFKQLSACQIENLNIFAVCLTNFQLKVSEQFRRNRIADCEKRSSNPTLSLTTIGTPAAAKAATTSGSGTAKVTNKGC